LSSTQQANHHHVHHVGNSADDTPNRIFERYKFGGAVLQAVQVEPAQHRAVPGDEHVEGAGTGLLLGQQGVVPLGELVVELIAPVGDQGSEVRAVRQLEGQHRRGMAGSQALQLGHRPTLPMVR
jgi:hypothetical protein